MRTRSRKFLGTIVLLLSLAVYVLLTATIGARWMATAPTWEQFTFFLAMGVMWVIPAGWLIRWMQRPD